MVFRFALFYKYEGLIKFYFFAFFFAFLVVFCLSPEVVKTYSTKMLKCEGNYEKNCFLDRTGEVWRAVVPFVNELNQALFVKTVFFESHHFEFKAEVELKHRAQRLDFRNVSKAIKCFENVCEVTGLMHIPYIWYKSYVVEIRSFTPLVSNVVEIQLQFINAQYSVYVILVSICLIGIELILLRLYLEEGESSQAVYVCFISVSLISFNVGVLIQFLLPFEGFWAYLAGILKIQIFFIVLLLFFIKVHWNINTKYKYSHVLIESFGLILYCWLRLEVSLMLSGQYNYLEIFKEDLNENKELVEKHLILSRLTKLIFVWVLVLSFLLTKDPGNSEGKKIFTYLDLALQFFTLLCTHLGLLSPSSPMNPLFFFFPFMLTLYIYIIQTQSPIALPVFKIPNSFKPNSESSRLLEQKQD